MRKVAEKIRKRRQFVIKNRNEELAQSFIDLRMWQLKYRHLFAGDTMVESQIRHNFQMFLRRLVRLGSIYGIELE